MQHSLHAQRVTRVDRHRFSIKHTRVTYSSVFLRTSNRRVVAAAGGDDVDWSSMQDPNLQYPKDKTWIWSKAGAKQSLSQADHAGPCAPWLLNAVNFVHWLAFPMGFWVAYTIYAMYIGDPDRLTQALSKVHEGNIPERVFLLILGILSQTFSALTGLMMHEYEGWMISPFRNILSLPTKQPTPAEVDQVYVQHHNNAWLRSVAYYYLFLTQTWGLLFFVVGALGFQTAVLAKVAVAVAVTVIGPFTPRTTDDVTFFGVHIRDIFFTAWGQPVMPLAWSLFLVFVLSAGWNLWAYTKLFGSWMAALPALVTAAGGIIEGYVAEGTSNQVVHGAAVVIMLLGLYRHAGLYAGLP